MKIKKTIMTELGYLDSKLSKKMRRLSADTLLALARSKYTMDLMEKIEAEPDYEKKNELKGHLFAALFMCQYNEDRPSLETAEPSGLTLHDFDHVDFNIREFYEKNISGKEDDLGIIFAHISPRGKGLRLVTTMNDGESVVACQERIASELGLMKYKDESVKDITRLSFIPSEDYILYINKEQFEAEREVTIEEKSTVSQAKKAVEPQSLPVENTVAMAFEYQGITYDAIIRELLSRIATDGTPREGERNVDLYSLVRELRHITNYQFEMTRMLVAPYFPDLPDAEIRRTINSAINSTGRSITPTMRGVLAQLQAEKMPTQQEDLMTWPKTPELPPLMQMLAKHYPKRLSGHVALAMLPILGVYGTHIRFRYLDNRKNSLSFMVAVVGKSASGKSFVNHLFEATTQPLNDLDSIERAKDQEYQTKLERRKQDESYPEDPRAKVRLYSDDTTTSQLLEYQDNLGDEHGLQYTEEVARLTKARKSRYADNDDIYCKAFDNGVAGKDSKNRQTRNVRTKIHLNTLFCGTPRSMHTFYNNPEGGLNNRVIYPVVSSSLVGDIPRYENLTAEEQEMLNSMIDFLWKSGTVEAEDGKEVKFGDTVHFGKEYEFPFLDTTMRSWIKKCNREEMENPDETWRQLANRAAVMGYRAGALAWFLWGCPDDKKTIRKIQRFAVWVAEVARISIYNFCGDEYDQINLQEAQTKKVRNTKNKKLLSLLPDVFTTQDVIALRLQNGDSNNVRMVITRWSEEGLIVKMANGQFHKTKSISA